MVNDVTFMRFRGVMAGWRVTSKLVDALERTIKFYQEIFDEDGRLVEIHEKYPVNKGHIRVKGGGR